VIPTGDHRLRRHAVLVVALLLWLSPADLLAQTTKLRVAICARIISMGVGSPFAVAMKEMIDEINRVDPAKIAAEAAVYRYRR
jgi:hypothetical protein